MARCGAGVLIWQTGEGVNMSEHAHTWEIDTTRKHKRPPRVFVRCACGATGQSTVRYGAFTKPFHINQPKYVPVLFDITPEQKARLKKIGRQSEVVRLALDNYFEQVYTPPHKS